MSGERFGSGLIVNGSLLRGGQGGAGELHVLDLVDGVGSAEGLGAVARRWAAEAIEAGAVPTGSPSLRRAPAPPSWPTSSTRPSGGDTAAEAIVERLAERLARVSAVLAGLLDVEQIIVCGGAADAQLLGPDGRTEIVKAALELLHRRAAEERMARKRRRLLRHQRPAAARRRPVGTGNRPARCHHLSPSEARCGTSTSTTSVCTARSCSASTR